MGTVVLLPQDCLSTSKNQHRSHLSEAILHCDRASRVRKGTSEASATRDLSAVCPANFRKITPSTRTEWTVKSVSVPLRNNGSDSSQADGFEEEVQERRNSLKKSAGVREIKSDPKPSTDGPVFTILQRPRSKEAADELIVKFLVKVEEEKVLEGQHDQLSDDGEAHNGKVDISYHIPIDRHKCQPSNHSKSSEVMKLPGPRIKKGVSVPKVEEPNLVISNLRAPKLAEKKLENPAIGQSFIADQNVSACVSHPVNVMRKESYRGVDGFMNLKGLSQIASLKVTSENNSLKKASLASSESLRNKQNVVPSGISRLKRASTDPQVVKQLVGHYRSKTVNIPFSEAKSCNGFTRTTSMSCPERWAGPSYFSSPAPSSLPLPKFSLPSQKTSSFQSSMEVRTRNIPQVPDMESTAPLSSPPQGGCLDVAFATKSLRRMLKLDPL